MKTTKTLALVLALCLAFSCLAVAGAEGLSAPGETPIWTGAEPAKLSILMAPNQYVEDYETNAYTKYLEETLGIDIEFRWLPAADTQQKLTTMIGAGEELADVVNMPINTAVARQFGEAGAYVDLKPYLDKGLGVNIDKAVAAFPDWNLITIVSSPEGALYGVPYIQASPTNETRYKMWVNEKWLKNLGIEVPTTTEEFYNMLVAFKEKDANGNGDATDEIPFATTTGYGGTMYMYLLNSFVFQADQTNFWMLKDGHVTTSFLQDGWYEGLAYIKKLVDEGLLTKESATQTNDDLKPIITGDEDVIGATTNSSLGYMSGGVGGENESRLRYICIPPLKGPEGVCYSAYNQSATQIVWAVTSDAVEHGVDELAFRVGDFQFTESGFLWGRYGIEGENWMTAEDYLAANPGQTLGARFAAMGYEEPAYVMYNQVWDAAQNNNWHMIHPCFSGTVELLTGYVADDGQGNTMSLENSATLRQEATSAYYQLVKPGADVYVPSLAYTDDEVEENNEFLSTMQTYVREQVVNYIIGEASDISDREAFEANLENSFQLSALIEMADAAYQRQYAAK